MVQSLQIMKRDNESRLLDFCVHQHDGFEVAAWEQFDAVSPHELATVARYLAGVDWYGHQHGLTRYADAISSDRFTELAQRTRFDPSRFAGLLKARLAHHRGTAALR